MYKCFLHNLKIYVSLDGLCLLMHFIDTSNLTGQAFSFNTKQLWNQMSTDEGSPNDDDSYLGYSVASGEFTGDNTPDVAVGMPRGANLTGKVSKLQFRGIIKVIS